MSNEIKSDKLYIKDIFNRWYRIPEYQRPYVWGKDQINDLLDDISFAQQNDNESEYFLGSIVFQTKTNNNGKYQEDDLLDGQQRLTTLFLITAVIRDLTENEKLKNICKEIIYQDENEFDGTPERIRIIFDIREEVKEFVDKFINPILFAVLTPRHLSGAKSIFLPLFRACLMIVTALELVHTTPPICPTFALTSAFELIYTSGKILSLGIPASMILFTASSK